MRRAALMAAATAAMAVPAIAVDGVFEINQACVATGCFPEDGPGFPVEIGMLGSLAREGSYRLTSNLVVPDDDTTAILVLVSNVVIDLNGFTIRGQYQCGVSPPNCPGGSARAIDGQSAGAVEVRNGTITGFGGVAVVLGDRSRAAGLTVHFVGGDGIVADTGSVIRDNRVEGVQGDGVRLAFGANDTDGLIEGNVVRSTRGDGIQAASALLLGNQVSNVLDEDARLNGLAGYGHNRFDQAPVGGTSMGDNVCGAATC